MAERALGNVGNLLDAITLLEKVKVDEIPDVITTLKNVRDRNVEKLFLTYIKPVVEKYGLKLELDKENASATLSKGTERTMVISCEGRALYGSAIFIGYKFGDTVVQPSSYDHPFDSSKRVVNCISAWQLTEDTLDNLLKLYIDVFKKKVLPENASPPTVEA